MHSRTLSQLLIAAGPACHSSTPLQCNDPKVAGFDAESKHFKRPAQCLSVKMFGACARIVMH